MVRFQVTIQESKLGDYPTADVRQERKADAVCICEPEKDVRRIVADPNQADAAPVKVLLDSLQLN